MPTAYLPLNAARLPHAILAKIFQFLKLRDLRSAMQACRHWKAYLDKEDTPIWSAQLSRLPELALADPYLLSDVPTAKAKLRAFLHAWNPADCSKNSYIKSNAFTLHRNPIAQSTDGARGRIGFQAGRHAWEVWWEGPLGTVAVVGVATRHAALQCPGYLGLLGSDDQGWGWNLVDGTLLHNGTVRVAGLAALPPALPAPGLPGLPSPPPRAPAYQVGEKIRLVLDCEAHVLHFEKGAEFLGVGFRDLPPVRLYPAVCAVYGNTEVSMVYLGPPVDG